MKNLLFPAETAFLLASTIPQSEKSFELLRPSLCWKSVQKQLFIEKGKTFCLSFRTGPRDENERVFTAQRTCYQWESAVWRRKIFFSQFHSCCRWEKNRCDSHGTCVVAQCSYSMISRDGLLLLFGRANLTSMIYCVRFYSGDSAWTLCARRTLLRVCLLFPTLNELLEMNTTSSVCLTLQKIFLSWWKFRCHSNGAKRNFNDASLYIAV